MDLLTSSLYPSFHVFPRKKKKDKEKKRHLEEVVMSQNDEMNDEMNEEVKTKKTYLAKRTPAQVAFDKMQEKRVSHV